MVQGKQGFGVYLNYGKKVSLENDSHRRNGGVDIGSAWRPAGHEKSGQSDGGGYAVSFCYGGGDFHACSCLDIHAYTHACLHTYAGTHGDAGGYHQ